MIRKSLSVLLVPVFFFIASSIAAGASLSVSSSGNGVYTVQGSAMDGIATVDLTVTYNSATLSSPSVSQGSLISGAMMVANTNIPGSIRIAIVSTSHFSGSGPVVIISFANKGTGTVQIANIKLTDNKGIAMSATALYPEPGIPFSETTTSTSTSTSTSTATTTATTPSSTSTTASTSQPTSLGTVSMPGVNQPGGDVKPAKPPLTEPPQQPPEVAEKLSAATEPPAVEQSAEPVTNAELKQTVYVSILERFHTYQGERTPASMMMLFANALAPAIRQEPAIAISDGTTNVRIIIDLPAFAVSSPNFALSGARMVSLKKGAVPGRWILEALPGKNAMNASVTILNGNSVIEYPLTTVSSGVKVSPEESTFSAFLKDAGTKVPKHDLNGDGRHDYMDDYIYTALYLIQKK